MDNKYLISTLVGKSSSKVEQLKYQFRWSTIFEILPILSDYENNKLENVDDIFKHIETISMQLAKINLPMLSVLTAAA